MTRKVGILHVLFGGAFLLFVLFIFIAHVTEGGRLDMGDFLLLLALLPLPLVSFTGGVGLLRGRSWARTSLTILSGILVFAFPIGTMLGVFGLWVLIKDPDGDWVISA